MVGKLDSVEFYKKLNEIFFLHSNLYLIHKIIISKLLKHSEIDVIEVIYLLDDNQYPHKIWITSIIECVLFIFFYVSAHYVTKSVNIQTMLSLNYR